MRLALPFGVLRRRLVAQLHTQVPVSASHTVGADTFDIPHEPNYVAPLPQSRPGNAQTPSAELKIALETRGAPHNIWRTYKAALEERVSTSDDGSVQLPHVLDAQQHRQVLQSIGPVELGAKARARARSLRANVLHKVTQHTDLSTPQEHISFSSGLSAADASTFRRRAQLVLHNLEKCGGAQIEDYNYAFNILAQGGHMDEMLVLWDELAEVRKQGGPAPDSVTYNYMMFGMVRNLQQRSRRLLELFSGDLVPRGRASVTAASTNAQRIVSNASQMATQRVMKLVVEMLADNVVPNALTLDYAARLLRMTGQVPAFSNLLRLGFGIDIAHPDQTQTGLCLPTTQTLNTALLALGEQGTVSQMLGVYEVMTKPLPSKGGKASAVQPNTTTFATLIRHACTAPDTLFFAAALHPVQQTWLGSLRQLFGQSPKEHILTHAERETELQKRRSGSYQAVACYIVSESINMYRDGITALAQGLHVMLPEAVQGDQEAISALVKKREDAWIENGRDGIPTVVHGEFEASSAPLLFRPPQVAPTVQTLYPFFSHASRRRHPALLRWLMQQLDLLYVLRQTEEAVLTAAIANIAPSKNASRIRASLAVHRARVEREISALAWLRFSRLPARLETNAEYQRERKARRRHAKHQEMLQSTTRRGRARR
ncbi:hypothetical protein MCUN1_000828 [Malassezia cuniculi]|uniref:Uncharacterized protein n=1 Tax=Malassezia cuniculi TaxID=948313 RepID=A0AAF0EPM4_9BASI|nr:hypothetical protein MCUN1_000828 [Malassezia cuniculi]